MSAPWKLSKTEQLARWKTLAEKSERRTDALLHAVAIAGTSTDLDRDGLRNVLIAEYESALYHRARADGEEHQAAMEISRKGRKQVDKLAGW